MNPEKIINYFLNTINIEIIKTNSKYSRKLELYKKLIIANTTETANTIGCIIFSFDRALQLDALLRSFFLNTNNTCKLYVIYKASNKDHHTAYQEVINKFNENVTFNLETKPFKDELITALNTINTGKLFFLVDDIIFTGNVHLSDLAKIDTSKYVFSLRMGGNLNYSYVVDKPQKLPDFVKKTNGYLYWKWDKGDLDWSYPLSVDGHIFGREEINILINHYSFNSPNSLESILQKEKNIFMHRTGICYKKTRIVNCPCNKVQNEVNNLHGSLHQDELLKIWQSGKKIDINKLQGFVNSSVHEELPFTFINKI